MIARFFAIILLFVSVFSPLFAQQDLLGALSGSWDGDKGIGTVYLEEDGTGVLTFNHDGEVSMDLKIEIQNNLVIISQNEPNRYEFYSGIFPDHIARNITAKVRPMRWIFSLSDDWNTLDGEKETSFIKYDEFGDVLSVDNSYTRGARWNRLEGKVAEPMADIAPGTYSDRVSIALSCDTPGAEIVYTIDGSSPLPGRGMVYKTPFTIQKSAIIKYGAYKDGWQQSDVVTGKYVIEYGHADRKVVEFDHFAIELLHADFSKGNVSCSFRITNNLDSRWIGFQNARLFDNRGRDYWVKKEGIIRQDGWGGLDLGKGENTVFTLNFPVRSGIDEIKILEIYLRDRGKIQFKAIKVSP